MQITGFHGMSAGLVCHPLILVAVINTRLFSGEALVQLPGDNSDFTVSPEPDELTHLVRVSYSGSINTPYSKQVLPASAERSHGLLYGQKLNVPRLIRISIIIVVDTRG